MKNNIIIAFWTILFFAFVISILIFSSIKLVNWKIKRSEIRIQNCIDDGGQAITSYFGFYEKCIIGGDK